MCDALWQRILTVYSQYKSLQLTASEIDADGFREYVQPFLEIRSATDHIMRARAAELGFKTNCEPEYVRDCYKKALGHTYRALFDVADWLAVVLRERITHALRPYSRACITAVLPTYYTTLRPQVEKISMEIAKLRDSKDSSADGDTIESGIQAYADQTSVLEQTYRTLWAAVPSLEEWTAKERADAHREWWRGVLGLLLVAVVAAILGALTTLYVQGKRPADAAQEASQQPAEESLPDKSGQLGE